MAASGLQFCCTGLAFDCFGPEILLHRASIWLHWVAVGAGAWPLALALALRAQALGLGPQDPLPQAGPGPWALGPRP